MIGGKKSLDPAKISTTHRPACGPVTIPAQDELSYVSLTNSI